MSNGRRMVKSNSTGGVYAADYSGGGITQVAPPSSAPMSSNWALIRRPPAPLPVLESSATLAAMLLTPA